MAAASRLTIRAGLRGGAACIAAWLIACQAPGAQSVGRYAVTAEPVRVGLGDLGLCIAVDMQNPRAIWWWQPGASGCATRSTGPDLIPVHDPKVSRTASAITAEFQLGTHDLARPFIPVQLILEGSSLRSQETDSRVALGYRDNLTIPSELPRPRASRGIGLDHIPVAVRDLEAASATYRALGFSLKPGRPHANGIRNAHVKFPDGAGIELLTVPAAVDPLSTTYTKMIRAGDGPAFLSFHARDTAALHAALSAGGYAFDDAGGLTDLRAPALDYLLWIQDNRSPTDRPEHFAHPNGAKALCAVWIATDDGEALARLLVQLGGRRVQRDELAPTPVAATVVALDSGRVVILPARHQLLKGRPIIGATFVVTDLVTVRQALTRAGIAPWTDPGSANRVVVAPSKAHGLWLEFVAAR